MRGPMLELKDYVKSIPKIKDQLFGLVRMDIKEVASGIASRLMDAEFELFVSRKNYQRQSLVSVTKRNYRKGHYECSFAVNGLENLAIEVSRERLGRYRTNILDKYQRSETALKKDLEMLCV